MAGALIFNDYNDFCRQAAKHILTILNLSLVHGKRCSMVLSGGSTPEGIYKYLAENSDGFDWKHVDFFIGDERCVPDDHIDSNYRMIKKSFLDKIEHKPSQVFTINQNLTPQEGARDYHLRIREYLENNSVFDIVLLGMGPDGHTASLFPGYPEQNELTRLAVATDIEAPLAPYHRRITMTLPALNRSNHTVLLLRGGNEKVEIMNRVLHPQIGKHPDYPVSRIQPERGRTYWYFSQ
ncbi:6-phosphogluconolactonase [Oceanispirochaeta crateris]|jgi:6-phosphogluconolactonase|uniref:6-phosphogluconolactonase n=1 Tax=Oceanispirochaeta crateris TaxID=2518645 RepID=A0A5C1QM69_9SPIO|nr:6-phosphogluconolactonase [Oceanispirochaeta crateris]QEN08070.1 6-phosphogluconolactonase [Oceanispirochaeta crateris]